MAINKSKILLTLALLVVMYLFAPAMTCSDEVVAAGKLQASYQQVKIATLAAAPTITLECKKAEYIPDETAPEGYISEAELIKITEEIGALYCICPELLQSIAFHESSYRIKASNGDCVGLMQLNTNYTAERMEKLGVTDIYEPYSNVLMAADLIAELRDTTENGHDVYYVLMRYNMKTTTANRLYEAGTYTEYATSVVEMAAELERLHGK